MHPVLVAAVMMSMASCAGSATGNRSGSTGQPTPDMYPGALLDSDAIAGEFMWRQSVHATYRTPNAGEESASFDVILQKASRVLTVLGMAPYGGRAFLIEQRGQAITVKRFIDEELPVPPRFILNDIHRTFFRGIASQQSGGQVGDGTAHAEIDGERITEVHRGGRLVRRRFERIDGKPAGAIVIDYGQGMDTGRPPPVITLDNGWFDYRLVIKTVEATRL